MNDRQKAAHDMCSAWEGLKSIWDDDFKTKYQTQIAEIDRDHLVLRNITHTNVTPKLTIKPKILKLIRAYTKENPPND